MDLETAINYSTKFIEYIYWGFDLICDKIKYYLPPNKDNISTCKTCIHDARTPGSTLKSDFASASKIVASYTEKISVGGTNPINQSSFLKEKTIVKIPMVFHLLDPSLNSYDIKFFENLINNFIIKTLNQDFNRGYYNYKDEYLKNVNTLFKNSDVTKLNYYTQCAERLSKLNNITWVFSLDKIIIKPTKDLNIDTNADNIYKSSNLVDPESYLNIIVAPATDILGISVFPFWDRDSKDMTKISSENKYRNGILMNTKVFLGGYAPYNLFRTFTHEIGHWAGLLHPFDNDSFQSNEVKKYNLDKLDFDKTAIKAGETDQDCIGDLVADTAPQTEPVYGTVYDSFVKVRQWVNGKYVTTNVRQTPYSKVFENNNYTPNFYNFMDYTDDGQMCFFTHLQHMHMLYMLKVFRPNFIKSN